MNPIDTALALVTSTETAYNLDVTNVANIQSGITTATAAAQTALSNATGALAPAQAQLVTDTATYVAALNGASAAFLAQATALTPAVVVPVVPAS